MTSPKAARPSSAPKHIDLVVARRLLAAGLSATADGRALGCSGPNIVQRLRRERDPVAERERAKVSYHRSKKKAAEMTSHAQAATTKRNPAAGHGIV